MKRSWKDNGNNIRQKRSEESLRLHVKRPESSLTKLPGIGNLQTDLVGAKFFLVRSGIRNWNRSENETYLRQTRHNSAIFHACHMGVSSTAL